MLDISDEAWQRIVSIEAWWRNLRPLVEGMPDGGWIEVVPDADWSDMQERHSNAVNDVRAQPELMNRLRSASAETDDPIELASLYQVLRGAVLDHQLDPDGIRRDARVLWNETAMETRLSVYVSEGMPIEPPYPAEEVDPRGEEGRELTRIGGMPTRVPGVPELPDSHFLLQFDCAVLAQQGVHEGVVRVRRERPFPRAGVLQLFHTVRGDSLTMPNEAGGGATLRHVSEDALRHREPAVGSSRWPASMGTIMVLPSFGTKPGADRRAALTIDELQAEADILARSGYGDEAYLEEFERNPLSARAVAPSRLYPLPAPGFELTAEESACLHARLPLRTSDDSHVLFIEVTAGRTFSELLGDDGRVQVWLRQSDAKACRYGDVVSFLKRGEHPAIEGA